MKPNRSFEADGSAAAQLQRFYMHIGRAALLLLIASCLVLAGCGSDQAIVWSAKAASPNGQLVASAETTQVAGPGTAWVGTSVHLEQANVAHPLLILSFANDSAYPPGATAVTLHWLSNSQLDVTYKSGAAIEFQAVKALGVTITIEKQGACFCCLHQRFHERHCDSKRLS